MKKVSIAILFICLILATPIAVARPAKDLYDGKTAGNSGFANIVGDNFPENEVNGWVRYSKVGKGLHTTWVIWGLEPYGEYQLKLHSKEGDAGIGNACGHPNEFIDGIWYCGFWNGESFLVMAIVEADEDGHISYGVFETIPVSINLLTDS